MMVILQDARKLDFPNKFDVVWLGPSLIRETFLNNSVQLESLNEKTLRLAHQAIDAKSIGLEGDMLLASKKFWIHP